MIDVIIQGEAPSTPNLREHWAAKAKRTRAQRAKVMAKMPPWPSGPLLFIRLTRVAPMALDTDNLAGALKGHRDAVAARLRVDDGSPLVHWSYAQAKGEASVVVQMWGCGEVAPAAYLAPRGDMKTSTVRLGDAYAAYVAGVGAEDRALSSAHLAKATFAPRHLRHVSKPCGRCIDCIWTIP